MPIIGKLTKRDGTVILPNTRAEAVIMDDEGTTLTEAMEDVCKDYTANIPYTSWTGSSAPYTKTVTVSGIVSTDSPFIDVVPSGTYATDVAMQTNWSQVYRAVTGTNSITFYSKSIPTADIPIMLKVVK